MRVAEDEVQMREPAVMSQSLCENSGQGCRGNDAAEIESNTVVVTA